MSSSPPSAQSPPSRRKHAPCRAPVTSCGGGAVHATRAPLSHSVPQPDLPPRSVMQDVSERWLSSIPWQYVVMDQRAFNRWDAEPRIVCRSFQHRSMLLLIGCSYDGDHPFRRRASLDSWVQLVKLLIPRLAQPESFRAFYGYDMPQTVTRSQTETLDATACDELCSRLLRSLRPFILRRLFVNQEDRLLGAGSAGPVTDGDGVPAAYERIMCV
eukprot:COSAG06_NODE_2367_length_7000_cov_16.568179_2_plen_214_part_00